MATEAKREVNLELVLKKFNDWADERISDYQDMPRYSQHGRDIMETRINMLQISKINLARILKETQNEVQS